MNTIASLVFIIALCMTVVSGQTTSAPTSVCSTLAVSKCTTTGCEVFGDLCVPVCGSFTMNTCPRTTGQCQLYSSGSGYECVKVTTAPPTTQAPTTQATTQPPMNCDTLSATQCTSHNACQLFNNKCVKACGGYTYVDCPKSTGQCIVDQSTGSVKCVIAPATTHPAQTTQAANTQPPVNCDTLTSATCPTYSTCQMFNNKCVKACGGYSYVDCPKSTGQCIVDQSTGSVKCVIAPATTHPAQTTQAANPTTQPPPMNCDTLSATQCTSHNTCQLFYNKCVKACGTFTSANCPKTTGQCTVEGSTGKCVATLQTTAAPTAHPTTQAPVACDTLTATECTRHNTCDLFNNKCVKACGAYTYADCPKTTGQCKWELVTGATNGACVKDIATTAPTTIATTAPPKPCTDFAMDACPTSGCEIFNKLCVRACRTFLDTTKCPSPRCQVHKDSTGNSKCVVPPTTTSPSTPTDTTKPPAPTCDTLTAVECKNHNACAMFNQKCVKACGTYTANTCPSGQCEMSTTTASGSSACVPATTTATTAPPKPCTDFAMDACPTTGCEIFNKLCVRACRTFLDTTKCPSPRCEVQKDATGNQKCIVPSNTPSETTRPPAPTCDTLTAVECKNHNACAMFNQKCVKACGTYTANTCPSGQCEMSTTTASGSSACVPATTTATTAPPKPCTDFAMDACPTTGCEIFNKLCVRACRTFLDTTKCPSPRCQVHKDSTGNEKCIVPSNTVTTSPYNTKPAETTVAPKSCADLTLSQCAYDRRCVIYQNQCTRACHTFTDVAKCPSPQCEVQKSSTTDGTTASKCAPPANSFTKPPAETTLAPKSCSDFLVDWCPKDRCMVYNKHCIRGCRTYLDVTKCPTPQCEVGKDDNGNSRCGLPGGTVAPAPTSLSCKDYGASMCPQRYCMVYGDRCMKACSLFDTATCPQTVCTVVKDATTNTGKCTVATTAAPTEAPKTCRDFGATDCPGEKCTVWNQYCVPKCAHFPKDRCPGRCVVFNSLCAAKCESHTVANCPVVSCLALTCPPPQCQITSDLCKPKTTGDWCSQYTAAECPTSTDRCEIQATNTEKKCVTKTAVDTPAPTTLPTKCFEATDSVTCNLISKCQWFGRWCIDLGCERLTTKETCLNGGCRATLASTTAGTSTYGCYDPHWFKIPCEYLPGAKYCGLQPNTCMWDSTATKCGLVQTAVTSAPSVAPTTCKEVSSQDRCQYMSRCKWADNICIRKTCADFTKEDCPDKACTVTDAGVCRTSCPLSAPFFCETTKRCASSSYECTECSAGQVQCWDSSCKSSYAECPCPEKAPIRCANRKCAVSLSDCDVTCATNQVKCWDNSCVAAFTDCPCPTSNPVKCSNNGKCVTDEDMCTVTKTCPSDRPVACWDDSCAATAERCPCSPNTPFRCKTDHKCYENAGKCPCPTGTTRCSTSSLCVTDTTLCSACATGKVKCHNGECKDSLTECACDETATATPYLKLSMTTSTVEVSKPYRIGARARLVACGVEVFQVMKITWAVSGGTLRKTLNLEGDVLSIPENTFVAGSTYAIEAKATSKGGQAGKIAIKLTAQASQPKLDVIGGDREVPATGFALYARVQDPTLAAGTSFVATDLKWTCCVPNANSDDTLSFASACGADCPTSLPTKTGAAVKFPGPILAGTYLFAASYKGVIRHAKITVMAATTSVLGVKIVTKAADVHMVTHPFTAYAVVNASLTDKPTLTWRVGDTVITGATGRLLSLTAAQVKQYATTLDENYFLKVGVSVTTTGGKKGAASMRVRLMREMTGAVCAVKNAIADETTIYGGKSSIVVSSKGWSISGMSFHFGYKTASGEMRALASFKQEDPEIVVLAPFVDATTTLAVVVSASYEGQRNVAHATCQVTITRPLKVDTVVTEQGDVMSQAVTQKDTQLVLQTAQVLSQTVEHSATITNKTERARVAREVVRALYSATTTDNQEMSSTQRAEAVNILHRMYAKKPATTAAPGATAAPTPTTNDLTDKATQSDMINLVTRVLKTTDQTDAIDCKENGKALLEVIGSVAKFNKTESAVQARQLCREATRQLSSGETVSMETPEYKIKAESAPALDLVGKPIGDTSATMEVPQELIDQIGADDTTELAINTLTHKHNPTETTAGAGANAKVSGDITEFEVQQGGQVATVTNLKVPCKMEIAYTPGDETKPLHCYYWDGKEWSQSGITDGATDITTGVKKCESTHLSMYGIMAVSSVTGDDTEGSTEGMGVGAIAGIAVGSVLLVGVAVGLASRKKASRQGENDTSAVPLNNLVDGPFLANDNMLLGQPNSQADLYNRI